MSDDRPKDDEKFVSRWSRLKQEARTQPPAAPQAKPTEPGPAPELPPLESLTFDSDFKSFMHPKVDENLRRVALKKLFSDPHFNRIDGLDVYIDDYTTADPIPPDLLKSLMEDRRSLFARDEPEVEETVGAAGSREVPQVADVTGDNSESLPVPELHPDVMPDATQLHADASSPEVPQPDPDGKLTAAEAETPAGAKENDTRSS
ncbi:MAG: DUF3306 domain-containing protein [Burkholderiales bacterium]